jgi:hypothetical protein
MTSINALNWAGIALTAAGLIFGLVFAIVHHLA